MPARLIDTVSALTFDVFGTILDLSGSLVPPLERLLSSKETSIDADGFWDRWRARQRVEQFQDTLLMLGHSGYLETCRRALVYCLRAEGIAFTHDEIEEFMGVWQDLVPFDDAVQGLEQLRGTTRLVALSNGEPWFLEHLVNNRIKVPFDRIISVEEAGAFKPHPSVYRTAARILDSEPGEIMMVAAHSFDIMGARACGYRLPGGLRQPLQPSLRRDPVPAGDSGARLRPAGGPSTGERLMAQRPDVVVVGGGVIGCSIAYFLAKAGASVTVLERGRLGAEASTAGSGGVGYVPGTGPYSQLGKMSLELFQTLSGELLEFGGVDMEFANCGQLAVALDEAEAIELRQVIDEYQRLGEDVRWLEPQEVFDIEPLLNSSILGAMHRPGVSRVNNQRLSGAYARAGMQMGAEFRQSTEVIGLARTGKTVTGVKTHEGDIGSGHVVIAAGAWSGLVAGWLDMAGPSPAPGQSEVMARSVPVWPVRGQNLNLQPSAGGIRTIVHGSWGVLVPRNDGSVVAGVTVEEVGFDSRTTVEGVSSILELATRIVPSFGDATLNWAIAGLRPGSPDEIPVMGALPGWEGVSVASGHYRDGITMSAVTGKLMADHLTGKEPELLATFSPSRFQKS